MAHLLVVLISLIILLHHSNATLAFDLVNENTAMQYVDEITDSTASTGFY